MDDETIDLAEIDGFIVGLADSYLHHVSPRADRTALSCRIKENFCMRQHARLLGL
jgi:hypothetical protein